MAYLMVDVLEALELDPPRSIPGHIHCPIHDDVTPSLWVQKSRWHCFGCGVGGDGVDLVRAVTGASWGQAKQFLSGLGDVDLPEHEQPTVRVLPDLTERFERETSNPWVSSWTEADAFVTDRWPHLSLGQLTDWGVGVGRNHLWIPHRDDEGVVRGIKLRTFSGARAGDKSAIPGSVFTSRLYRVEDRPTARYAWVCEGESDTWTLTDFTLLDDVQVLGLPSGAQTIKQEFVDELKRFEKVWVCLDADETGDKAADALMGRLGASKRSRPDPGFKDWTEQMVSDRRRESR